MPDWKAEVQARLASLNLSPTREAEIVDELSRIWTTATASRSPAALHPRRLAASPSPVSRTATS
jgi:hypothetical protein